MAAMKTALPWWRRADTELEDGRLPGNGRGLRDERYSLSARTICWWRWRFGTWELATFVVRPSCCCAPSRQQQQQQQHPFSGPSSGTTRISWYQKGKTNLDLLEQETVSGNGISWAIMQICISFQTDNDASTHHPVCFYRPDALPAAQPTASKHW